MEAVIYKSNHPGKALPITRALIIIFLLILLEIGGAFIYQTLVPKINISPLIFTAFQRLIGAAILIGFVYSWGYNPEYLGLSLKNAKRGIAHAIFWCLGFGLIVGLCGGILYLSGVNPLSIFFHQDKAPLYDTILYFLVGCFLGPIVEDLVFIGLFYNSIRNRLNIVLSVLIVSTIFSFSHRFISLFLIIQFIGGLLFSLSFEFSGSLFTPIIIHCLGNCAISILQLL